MRLRADHSRVNKRGVQNRFMSFYCIIIFVQIYALVYFVELSRYILNQSDDCHNDHVASSSSRLGWVGSKTASSGPLHWLM